MTENKQNNIAFQGIAGAHSDMACKKAYPYMNSKPYETFEDVFNAVEKGEVNLGLIPIENSHAGRVAEISNLLPESGLQIVGEYFHKVKQHLVTPKDATMETVKAVYSHPQALMQCRKSLRDKGFKPEPYGDTASAARDVAEWNDNSKAALSSDLAAELYGLKILQQDFQDSDDNVTHFIAISKEPLDIDLSKEDNIITSILFTTRNIPASLYKALGGFASNGVNMLKLESHISDYGSGTAQFFITFEGHPEMKNVQLALEELGFFTKKVDLLGVYPADR